MLSASSALLSSNADKVPLVDANETLLKLRVHLSDKYACAIELKFRERYVYPEILPPFRWTLNRQCAVTLGIDFTDGSVCH